MDDTDPASPVPRCLLCRYDLSGCTGERCPECGWRIERDKVHLGEVDAAVVRLQRPSAPTFTMRCIMIVAVTAALLTVAGMALFALLAVAGIAGLLEL